MMLSAACRNTRLFFVLGGLFCGIAAGQTQPAAPASVPTPTPSPAAPAPAGREAKVSLIPALPVVTRGQTVSVTGENFPTQGVQVFLRTGREKTGDNGTPVDAVGAAAGESLR